MLPVRDFRWAVRALVAVALATGAPVPTPASAQGADSAAAEEQHTRARGYMMRDQFDSAAAAYTAAVRIRTALNDSAGLASSLNSLGAAHYQVGEYELALEAFLRSLELRRALHDSIGVSRVLANIGKTYQDWRQFDRSLVMLNEAVATAERIDAPLVLAYAVNTLALLKSDLGEQAEARALIDRSIALYASRSPPRTRVDSATSGWLLNSIVLGLVEVRDGRPERAIPLLNHVARVAAVGGSPRGEARARLYLGQAYRANGEPGRAMVELERALSVARATRQRVIALEALREIAELEEARGNSAAALRQLRAVRALNDTIFDQSTAQRLAVMESRIEQDRQQRENARLLAERLEQRALILRQRVVGVLGGLVILLALVVVLQLVRYNRRGREREAQLAAANAELARTNADLERVNAEVSAALAEVRTLKGFIPICAHCKSVRDDRGFWEAVETYVSSRSEAMFSHSICPKCGPRFYGDAWPEDEPGERPGEAPGGAPGPSPAVS
jgi:tetratricopeptide (TPR) repeat protein